ncbi:MAG: aminopeptidase P family protein [Betaproteobacteria bacterium]|nr:aminopeptidase P family protein [Betaproteobacteria bacterium]
MDNDWNKVRRELDKSDNFEAICNSPWYSDTVYNKFSDEEFARRHEAARELMVRDGLDALILTGGPDIYSHGSGVTWGAGLIDDRGMCQYMVLPLKGEPTIIYPHYGCHIEAARKQVSVRDVRSGQHGKYGKAVAERLIELNLQKGRIGIVAADRTGPEYMGVQAYFDMQKLLPQATFVFCPNLLHELTYRKSAEELRAMAKAGQLAIKALEAVKATAKPGVREYQLAGAVANAVMSEGGRYHLLMIGSTSMHDPKLIFPNPNPSARVLKEGDIVLSELAMSYMGYSAKIGHPVSIGRPTEKYSTFFKDVVVGGFKEIASHLKPGTTLEDMRKVGSRAFRDRGAQSRPTIMHGLDLITSVPFIRADRVRAEPYETTMQPGMTYNIEITPVDKEGVFGIFYSRSFAITEGGAQDLTPYPVDEILVAG